MVAIQGVCSINIKNHNTVSSACKHVVYIAIINEYVVKYCEVLCNLEIITIHIYVMLKY